MLKNRSKSPRMTVCNSIYTAGQLITDALSVYVSVCVCVCINVSAL